MPTLRVQQQASLSTPAKTGDTNEEAARGCANMDVETADLAEISSAALANESVAGISHEKSNVASAATATGSRIPEHNSLSESADLAAFEISGDCKKDGQTTSVLKAGKTSLASSEKSLTNFSGGNHDQDAKLNRKLPWKENHGKTIRGLKTDDAAIVSRGKTQTKNTGGEYHEHATSRKKLLTWEEKFVRLKNFKAKHGHMNVPSTFEDRSLACFVISLRNLYKKYIAYGTKTTLTEKRMQLLESLGFNWLLVRGKESSQTSSTATNSGDFPSSTNTSKVNIASAPVNSAKPKVKSAKKSRGKKEKRARTQSMGSFLKSPKQTNSDSFFPSLIFAQLQAQAETHNHSKKVVQELKKQPFQNCSTNSTIVANVPMCTDGANSTAAMSHQQRIETITRNEALRHVEMAWRAQQRLVQRCLGLQLSKPSAAESKTVLSNDSTSNVMKSPPP